VGTNLGTVDKSDSDDALQVVGAKGGLEPLRFYPPDPKFLSHEESVT